MDKVTAPPFNYTTLQARRGAKAFRKGGSVGGQSGALVGTTPALKPRPSSVTGLQGNGSVFFPQPGSYNSSDR